MKPLTLPAKRAIIGIVASAVMNLGIVAALGIGFPTLPSGAIQPELAAAAPLCACN